MRERLYITAGGLGSRISSINTPKAIAQLPDGGTVLDRIMDQLSLAAPGMDITICTGFMASSVEGMFPETTTLRTMDPSNPTGILSCIHHILDVEKYDSYTFLLGDTIWSPAALKEALSTRHVKELVFYGNRHRPPCETYMFTVSGSYIKHLFNLLTIGDFPIPPATRRKAIEHGNLDKYAVTVSGGKLFQLNQWMLRTLTRNYARDIRRVTKAYPVDDFDTDEEMTIMWRDYVRGVYDVC